MFSLIPETTHVQKLRMKRFLMAFFSYLVFIILILISHQFGIFSLPMKTTLIFIGMVIAVNIGFYIIFYKEWNKKFKDKSLTIEQMICALAVIMVTLYYTEHMRGTFLLLYVVCFLFGLFRLNLKKFFLLALAVISSYLMVAFMLMLFHPDRVNIKYEIVRLIALTFVFIWFSFLGGYISDLRKKIEDMAVYDDLTRIFNRRELFNILQREKELADRGNHPFCILMTDIDDFKKINDRFGHIAGDLVLKSTASKLAENLRSSDYIGRYGGEEFLMMLAYPTLTNALICSERLRSLIDSMDIEYKGEKIKTSISIGATVYNPGETLEEMIARADHALYQAKKEGKNRVKYSEPPVSLSV